MTGYRAITRARKIVFWVSAVLFILTWPLLVLYAFGIVISPSVSTRSRSALGSTWTSLVSAATAAAPGRWGHAGGGGTPAGAARRRPAEAEWTLVRESVRKGKLELAEPDTRPRRSGPRGW